MSATPPPVELTLGTSIGDLIKNAFFAADSVGEAQVEAISPTQINVYHPLDGSMVTLRLEARTGRWGGISATALSDEEKEALNKRFNEQKAIAEAALEPASV